jgi:hypothetical protein
MSDLRNLVGDDSLDPDELERLERVHALLERAGPPPELPPSLAKAPKPPSARVVLFPRRYRYTALAAAAIAAVAIFGLGYLAAGGPDPSPVRTVTMAGAAGARAELDVFAKDEAGNWPMELRVEGLREGTYELWLTKQGELAEPCGSFLVSGTEIAVPLNAPFVLKDFDGWVVVRGGQEEPVLTT